MLVFVLLDVCVPEQCGAQMVNASQDTVQIQAQGSRNNGDTCQFEEDCFNCAHYAPGMSLLLGLVDVVAFSDPDVFVSVLDGAPGLPYHPPRA